MPIADTFGMEQLSTEFRELFKRVEAHEVFVEGEFRAFQTAMDGVKADLQRRIDRLDERMDRFLDEHGGEP